MLTELLFACPGVSFLAVEYLGKHKDDAMALGGATSAAARRTLSYYGFSTKFTFIFGGRGSWRSEN